MLWDRQAKGAGRPPPPPPPPELASPPRHPVLDQQAGPPAGPSASIVIGKMLLSNILPCEIARPSPPEPAGERPPRPRKSATES
jgi:hypothetical protein